MIDKPIDSESPPSGTCEDVASAAVPGLPVGAADQQPVPSSSAAATGEDLEFTQFPTGWFETASGIQGELPGKIGHFRIVKRIKEGGMGAVFLASQTEPVQRKVAIKIIKRTLDTPEARRRLEVECQSLARFNHPNIASFIDCGFCQRIPFIVMELVDGKGMLEYFHIPASKGIAKSVSRPNLRTRLEVFLQACDGLWHAHQRGVIHRDISATNVMVQDIDGKPAVKIIDFGLSVLKEASEPGFESAHDRHGTGFPRMGTVAYMSPEQIKGAANAVDFRSDVYSMGVLLFELVTGERPYAVFTEKEALAKYESLAKPIAPSTKVQDVTRAMLSTESVDWSKIRQLRRLSKTLQGDLDAIVVKAMAIDPENRYGSVRELAEDLRAYLDCRPLAIARRASPLDRLGKFCRRNWAACTAGMMAVGLLAALAAISSIAAMWTSSLNAQLRKANTDLDDRRLAEENKRNVLDRAYKDLRAAQTSSYAAQIRGLPDLLSHGEIAMTRRILLDTALSNESKSISRGWEWNHFLGRIEASEMVLGLSRQGFVDVVHAGTRICGVAADGSVWFWKAGDGEFIRTSKLHRTRVLASWAREGKDFCQTLDTSGTLIRWTVENGLKEKQMALGDLRNAVAAFHPEGTHLCLHRPGDKELSLVAIEPGINQATVKLVLPANAERVRLSWTRDSLVCVAITPEQGFFGKSDLYLLAWTSEEIGRKKSGSKEWLGDFDLPQAIAHAGRRVLFQYSRAAIVLDADPSSDERPFLLRCHGSWLGAAAFNSEGTKVVTGGTAEDRCVRVWDARTGEFEGQFTGNPDDLGARLGHDREITKVTFTADGILSASMDGTIRKWSVHQPRYARRLLPRVPRRDTSLREQSEMSSTRFVQRGNGLELMGVFSRYPFLAVWSAETGKTSFEATRNAEESPDFLPKGYEAVFASASRDGTRIALARFHTERGEYDLIVGNLLERQKPSRIWWSSSEERVVDLAVSNDGRLIALSVEKKQKDGRILLWKLDEDRSGTVEVPRAETLNESALCCRGLAFDENATRLAACGKGLRIWSVDNSAASRFFHFAEGELRSPAFSRDGKKIAAGVEIPVGNEVGSGGLVMIDLESGEPKRFGKEAVEGSVVYAIAWDPVGLRFATAENEAIRIWSASDDGRLRLLLSLRDTPGVVDSIAWSPDGEWIGAACPLAGAFLFRGPTQDEHEANLFLRELQRTYPIRELIENQWRRFPAHHRFEKQLQKFLRVHGDDPGFTAEWAWRHLLPVDDLSAVDARTERWELCRTALKRAAWNWTEDPDLPLLLGIAEYRCGHFGEAAETLKNFVAYVKKTKKEALSWTGDGKTTIGEYYLAMAYKKKSPDRKDDKNALHLLEIARKSYDEYEKRRAGQNRLSAPGEGGVFDVRSALKFAHDESELVFKNQGKGR